MAVTGKEKVLFQERMDEIVGRLMTATGIKNKSKLGYWLFKNVERTSEMYFTQARHQGYLNYRILIDRCVEANIDLNEVFGKGRRTEDLVALNKKYQTLEEQVKELIAQNSGLLSENRKISEEFRRLSMQSHELMANYLKSVNQKK